MHLEDMRYIFNPVIVCRDLHIHKNLQLCVGSYLQNRSKFPSDIFVWFFV